MRSLLIITCVYAFVSITNAASVNFITKCKADDSKCIKDNAVTAIPLFAPGIPDVNVEPLDPLVIKKVDASTSSLKLIITDSTVMGMKNCRPKKLQRDVAKSKLYAKFLCDGTLDGNYEMGGQLFIVPIEGKGKIHVTLRKAQFNIEIDLTETDGKEEKKHWKIKSWKHSFELKDKADVVFENLFEGNEVLGQAARELVASSGNEIVTEIGPPVIKAIVGKMLENVDNFFQAVPLEDLVLD